jgi:two-component system, OmpR family, sensor histidine kinase SenX3
MILSWQLLVLGALPASFLALLVYAWWRGEKRRRVVYRWSLALLATAVWSSGILRFYSDFNPFLAFYWGKVATYAFSLAALGILLTTQRYLRIPKQPTLLNSGLSAALWLLALVLDPLFWPAELPFALLPGQPMRHFDLWVAVWIASWSLPLIAAWLLTAQANRALPASLYRNQVRYWLLTLSLFGISGILTTIRQTGQTFWQESGVLVAIFAALVGTISLTHWQLPDFQIVARQLTYRLSAALATFFLTWLALSLVLLGVRRLPPEVNADLIVLLASAGVVVLLLAVYRLAHKLARRLFLPVAAGREAALAAYNQAVGQFPELEPMGKQFLRLAQATVGSEEAWLFLAEDGPGGVLLLRPLATLTPHPLTPAEFAANSLFSRHLRQQKVPLIHYDLSAPEFLGQLPEEEWALLTAWGRILYAPLRHGDNLVGVIALGRKQSGEPYDSHDYAALATLCDQASPLLAQAQQLAALRQVAEHGFRQNQKLVWQNRQLWEMARLYDQCMQLISPGLKRPFTSIEEKLQQLHQDAANQPLTTGLEREIRGLRQPLDSLVNLATRIRQRPLFHLEQVHLTDVVQSAIAALHSLAEARQVEVTYHEPEYSLPFILADQQQLQEAVQSLLHNAIKFNKIGGEVQISSGLEEGDLFLRLADTGVGIPEERLSSIWDGLSGLALNGNGPVRLGIGLPLAQYIVAAHGGRIAASSRYGAGSVFTVYLPLAYLE